MGLGLWKLQHKIHKFYTANGSLTAYMLRNFELLFSINRAHAVYIYADATNIGDYISYLGVNMVFKKNGPSLHAASACLAETKNWLKFARKNVNLVLIIGGGGLIQNCFEEFWEVVLASGFPYILYGVGACNMKGVRQPIKEDIIARISQKALHIHVRDNETKELFERFGKKTVSLGECPATDFVRSRRRQHGLIKKENKIPILLNVIHEFDLSQNGVDLALYCQNIEKVCKDLGYQYSQTNNIHKKYETLLRQYEKADIIVTSRLHGCIIGAGMEKSIVAIDCDEKIKNYLHTHYHNPTIISPENVNSYFEMKKILDRNLLNNDNYVLLPLSSAVTCQNLRIANQLLSNYF